MSSKYSKLYQIGSGTFGQVWLVKSQTSERRYVIKEIQLGGMTSYERHQAVSEVIILAECRHQHIIRYKDAYLDEEKAQLSIVMEYADGGDLYTAIQKQNGIHFSEKKILNWFIQICLGLKYIHTLNILHRDLKTQNLFLTSTGIVKIGDFGIARFLKGNQDLATTAIGTPYYLSPEICQQKPYDHKSDMWSLGCVLYEMSSLSHPFHGRTFQELLMSILCCKYEPISSQYSLLLRDLVSVLLRVEPNRRPSASEILAIPAMQCHLYDYFSRHYWNRDNISEGLNMGGTPDPSLGADCDVRRHSTGVTNTHQPKTEEAKSVKFRKKRQTACDEIENHSQLSPVQSDSNTKISSTYTISRETVTGNNTGINVESNISNVSVNMKCVISERNYDGASNDILPDQLHSSKVALDKPSSNCEKNIYNGIKQDDDDVFLKFKGSQKNDAIGRTDLETVKMQRLQSDTGCLKGKLDGKSEDKQGNLESCPHQSHCQDCTIDLLWKFRIRSTGEGVAKRCLDELYTVLQNLLGPELHQALTLLRQEWHHEKDVSPLCQLKNIVRHEHFVCIPMLIQLIQLEKIQVNLVRNYAPLQKLV
ncbi:uncharacterized protein LOC143239281 isoform X2 [Tachypleus tridentatus]|uniref:uncharacterized protein LOC143239281 isoform X2 n=1 Tax=Tachypleus tridentatus TaxID=6853 RepID=UPI003FD32F7A